jgi:hypothetical protein
MNPVPSPAREHWYRWFVLVITCLGLAVGSMLVSIHASQVALDRERAARRQTEKAMCVIVVTLDSAYRANPPGTETGRKVARGMADLRAAYHCDEG